MLSGKRKIVIVLPTMLTDLSWSSSHDSFKEDVKVGVDVV